MKHPYPPVLALLSLAAVSCSSHLSVPSAEPVVAPGSRPRATSSRVLVKTGSMRVEVRDVEAAARKARQVVKKHRGFLETIRSSEDGEAYASLRVRIPKKALTRAMDELATLGRVTSRDVEVKDVTDEWIDMQAKLKNMRALRDRLRALLRQAKTVEDMLKVEKELTRVQSELDSLEARVKAMSGHAAYSKLTLSLSRKSVPGPIGAVGKGAWWGVKKLFVLR